MDCIIYFIRCFTFKSNCAISNQWLGDTLAFKVKHMLRQRVIYKNNGHPIGEQMTILTENIDGLAPFIRVICLKCSNQ